MAALRAGDAAAAGRDPDVSVIVPVYNAASTIHRAMDSLVGQTIDQGRVEVLVIDDGSTDESPTMLDRIAEEHPSFQVFHQPNSGGPAAPRNFAIERARGRYIFFLDQDDYLAPDALEAMIRMADENGTDIVAARMRCLGGRTTGVDLFGRTVARTDVFSSAIYRALNPIKLFRTSMIRSLGLKFSEDVRVYEDQPFVANAYFGCNGVSILSDKDYIFWIFREDASNISTSRPSLADRLPGAIRMFELLAERVPAGPKRDVLMRRHFELELMGLFRAYRIEQDPAMRDGAFERFRGIVAAYYTDIVDEGSPPRVRILTRLVAEGRADRLAEYLDAIAQVGSPEIIREGDHIFQALPWFRDAQAGLPDELFDIAPRLSLVRRVQPLDIGPTSVGVTGVCRFGPLTVRATEVSLVARARAGAGESTFPLAFHLVRENGSPFLEFDESVPVDWLMSLPNGKAHDLYLRVAAGPTWRERRLAECGPVPKLRVLRAAGATGAMMYGLLTMSANGSLAFAAVNRLGLVLHPLKRLGRSAAAAVHRRLGRTRT